MKIAINRRYGGFGISNEALFYLVEKNSSCIKQTPIFSYVGSEIPEIINEFLAEWTDYKNGYKISRYGLMKNEIIYTFNDEIKNNRANIDLIEVIEKLGENANGDYAFLSIIDIPDNISWDINEYDGWERIVETHRSWG